MFEAEDQFQQFIDSRSSTPNSLPLLLSFPNSNFHPSSSAFSTFESFSNSNSSSSSSSHPPHPHVSSHPSFLHKTEIKQLENNMLPLNLETQSEKSIPDQSIDPWSTDELLALFRIRSSLENWFPDFTWDHVSRKLAEFGFKKSPEMCKDKFEEESRYLNNMNSTSNFPKNYRVFGEFDDLYHSDNNNHEAAEKNKKIEQGKGSQEEEDKIDQKMDPKEENEKSKSTTKKRKREKSSCSSSFEMFKGFCEDIISTIIAQQEHMHNKLLEDMAKRDQENIARDEEWKKQEMDRIDKEFQLRTQEQVLASDRQTSIINFLNKLTSSFLEKSSNSSISSNPNPKIDKDSTFIEPTSSSIPNQNPNSSSLSPSQKKPSPRITSNEKDNDDLGKRWPKDEVLALINLRCSFYNEDEIKESTKGPLWERISKGMLELGYKRSSKRCKEKWENINKYFRKTKDLNKKRSLDSRTCPYFHQLSTLYTQGKLVATDQSTTSTLLQVDDQIQKNLVQASGFEFDEF